MKRADQPQYMYKGSSSPSWNSKKKAFNKQRVVPKKGAVNVTVTQHTEPQALKPAAAGKGQQRPSQGLTFAIRYTYPECSYTFSCPRFRKKTVSQRKSFVNSHSLCFKCLKPGHGVGECRNKINCRLCEGRHHVMLHPAQGESTTPTVTGAINTVHSQGSQHSFSKKKLLQTCE